MIVRVDIARSQREYGDVLIEAPSVAIAEQYVASLLADTDYSQPSCEMLNAVAWNSGDDTFDEDVIDSAEHEDQDEEPDIVVPDGWQVPPAEPEQPAPPQVTIDRALFDLLVNVASDASGFFECNCSYDSHTEPEDRCEGTCTASMAKRALTDARAVAA